MKVLAIIDLIGNIHTDIHFTFKHLVSNNTCTDFINVKSIYIQLYTLQNRPLVLSCL